MMPKRKKFIRGKKRLSRKEKTFTYMVGFPPYARVKNVNGFKFKMPAGQLFPSFGARVTVRNGHMRKVVKSR